ncbi:unnamed protein product [Rhizophagus irregularis]|nr:unnamed protein product [Rhizophagus irregularis]
MENVDSINKLIKEFEDFAVYLSKLITNESIIALKHVATGKYLSSNANLRYNTGSTTQLVSVENSKFGPNSLWKIRFNNNELATYGSTLITLEHVKSNMFLGINYGYYKSPSANHTEVSCINITNNNYLVKFNIGNNTFQEVVCHNERLGGNDEWCIELIKQYVWTLV